MVKKYIFLIITGFLFGSQFLFTRNALLAYTTIDVGLMRLLFGFIAVALLTPIFVSGAKKIDVPCWQYAIIGFFEGTLPCLLVPWGQQSVKTGIAAVIISTMPIFAILLGPLIIRSERFTWVKFATVITGFIGVCILINPGANSDWFMEIMPELAILLASASWAFSLILIKKIEHVSPFILTRNILLAATVETFIVWLVLGDPLSFRIHTMPLINGIILGALNSGVVYIFYVLLIRAAGVHFAAFSNYLVPIVGGLIGVIFLHEVFNLHEVIGFLIVIAGLLIETVNDIMKHKSNKK